MIRSTSLVVAVALCLCVVIPAAAQSPPSSGGPAAAAAQQGSTLDAIAAEVRALRSTLDAIQAQLADSRRESESLRRELQTVREQLDARPPVDALAEEQELLRAKVEDQEQTKVESGSRYHVRLSGLALLNAFVTRGSVDNLDVPEIAEAPGAAD